MFNGPVITLLAMSVAGVSRALLRSDREVVAVAAALACFLVAYSLSYVALTYHAIKVPLIVSLG